MADDPSPQFQFEAQACPGVAFHGVLLRFIQLGQAGPYALYRAGLVPWSALLALTRHNQVFLDQSLPGFIAACLKDGEGAGVHMDALSRDKVKLP